MYFKRWHNLKSVGCFGTLASILRSCGEAWKEAPLLCETLKEPFRPSPIARTKKPLIVRIVCYARQNQCIYLDLEYLLITFFILTHRSTVGSNTNYLEKTKTYLNITKKYFKVHIFNCLFLVKNFFHRQIGNSRIILKFTFQ